MTSTLTKVLLVGSMLALLTACTTPSRFEWGGYEQSLYLYSKAPDKGPVYEESLEAAIQKGRDTNRVAPGLLAELGYMKMKGGDNATAIALFEEEMQRFPESRVFLSRIVQQLRGGEASGTGAS